MAEIMEVDEGQWLMARMMVQLVVVYDGCLQGCLQWFNA